MPYLPNSGYTIDGYDLHGTWNITVTSITGLLAFYARKGETMQSWPDSDGETPFTSATDIYWDGRDVIMHCLIVGETAPVYNNFANLLRQFKAQLEKPQMHTLAVPYITTTYSLMYVKGSDVTFRTPRMKTSKVIAEFWVQFRETSPVRS
jgi:hypothetical protein